jgi:hypothetical protein
MARNRLPEPSTAAATPRGPASPWARLGAFLGWLSAREPLPESAAPDADRSPAFLHWLAARETLPEAPASQSDPDSLLRWLFRTERPADPPSERRETRP